MEHFIRSSTSALVAGMIAAGCASTPSASDTAAANAAIANAGQAVDHAAGDPNVARYASSELDRATNSLGKAKAAWNDKHDLQASTQLAYLAQQRATTAQELANERAAHEAVALAATRRDREVAAAEARHPSSATAVNVEQVQQGIGGFASGRAEIPPQAMPAIAALAAELKNNPGRVVVIDGHTDTVGPSRYNLALGMQRARAVRAALVREGIESSRITIRSHGEGNPVASNDTSAGREENRRVQILTGASTESLTGSSSQMGSSQGASATSSGEGRPTGQSGQTGQKGQNGQRGQ